MTEPVPTADRPEAALDAICRNALRLLQTARDTPARLRIDANGTCVEMEWPARTMTPTAAGQTAPVSGAATCAGPGATAPASSAAAAAYHGTGTEFSIPAPGVGTFHQSPAPGAAPFVQVGDDVKVGRQVGILEVMKLMIPVTADRPGRVVELLVPDGTPVEYGQPLIVCTST